MKLHHWVLLPLLVSPLAAQQIQINAQNRTIAVSTSDEASAVADTAEVHVGFESFGKDQDSLYTDASATSNAIIKALTASGVPAQAVESTGQGLRPLNEAEDKARWAEGERFAFSQSWRVTVPAEQASRVLQVAISAGANTSGDVTWMLHDKQALEADAAGKALAHARQIAAGMAKGLGVKLGTLIYAGNQAPPQGLAPQMRFGFGMGAGNGLGLASSLRQLKGAPLALTPERITESATVYAVFALE